MNLESRLTSLAGRLLDGDDPEDDFSVSWNQSAGMLEEVSRACAAGALPPTALEVAAGLHAIARPKDYGALALRKVLEELHAGEVMLRASMSRLEPLALLGSRWSEAAPLRRTLDRGRSRGPLWQAYRLAVEAGLAGSAPSADQLHARASEAASSPAIAWLAEFALDFAGDPRAAGHRARLDTFSRSGAYGRARDTFSTVVELGRTWTAGNRKWFVSVRSSLWSDAAKAEYDAHRELADFKEGPFHYLGAPTNELRKVLDAATHYLVVGFRQTYGYELLADAMRAWAAGGAVA